MKTRARLLPLVALIAIAGTWGMTPPAGAQTEASPTARPADDVEEILVQARRREERLQDVPASITVLDEVTLERRGVQRPEDFIALTPGVTIVDAAEVGDTQVNIRGINGSRDAVSSFAFILDGILMSNPSAFNREFSNLAQIEVLKGPQGALYGRNAAAGAILVTTRRPTDEWRFEARGRAGNEETYFVSSTVGGPLIEEQLWLQLEADWRESDGFFRNSFLDDDVVDDFENYNLNARLLWEPSDALVVDGKLRYGEVDAAAITFNPAFAVPLLTDPAILGPLASPLFFEDVNDHDFRFQPNIDPRNEQESIEASIKVDYELGWGTLTAWALYSDIEQDFLADGTSGSFGFFFFEPTCRASTAALSAQGLTLPPPQVLGPVPEFSIFGPYSPTTCDGYQYQLRDQEDVSFEIRLASPQDQRLRWLGGVYFLDIEREVGVATGIDQGLGIDRALFNPIGSRSPTEQLVHDEFDTQVFAVFGSLDYDLTDEIELSLALRYDREEREVENKVPTAPRTQYIDFTLDGMFTGGAPLNPGLDPTINPLGFIPDKDETFEEVQPKLSATWDVREDLTLFGSWGIGFKSGGFNNQGSAATVDLFINQALGANVRIEDEFDEETSSAFEIGFKARLWEDRISLEAAYYHVEVDDMQFFEFFVGPFGLLRVVSNIDEVTIDGFELGGSVLLFEGLNAYAGFNYTDSEIDSNDARPETEGNESPYTPEWTLNLGFGYESQIAGDWPVFGATSLVAAVDWAVVGPTWFHTIQDDGAPSLFGPAEYRRTERDTYDTLDLRAGLEGEHFGIYGFARNLLDEEYVEEVIPAPEFGGSFIHPAARRSYGVELMFRF